MCKEPCEGDSEKEASGTKKKCLNDLKTGERDGSVQIINSFLYIALCRYVEAGIDDRYIFSSALSLLGLNSNLQLVNSLLNCSDN